MASNIPSKEMSQDTEVIKRRRAQFKLLLARQGFDYRDSQLSQDGNIAKATNDDEGLAEAAEMFANMGLHDKYKTTMLSRPALGMSAPPRGTKRARKSDDVDALLDDLTLDNRRAKSVKIEKLDEYYEMVAVTVSKKETGFMSIDQVNKWAEKGVKPE